MKQILQHLRTGEMELADVPAARPGAGEVLIRTRRSLISAGTERMLVEFSQANLVSKARQQPEKVKQVLDKLRTDGIAPTLDAVFRKLDEPLPLGYCNAGVVLETGAGVHDLRPGDRVASNGNHAEIVCVPRNLCARVPDGVSDEEAAFAVLGSIALQGVRLAAPTLGEKFVVFGAGLLGLLTVQLLRASGCAAMAVDLNADRLKLAESFGARTVDIGQGGDPVRAAMEWSGGAGIDGAIVTAAAKSDDIMHQAAQACRKRGRIVLVGVVGLNLRRSDFFEKELTFQVSCSYGPGRYDEAYEQQGHDYPAGFVRWTEQRNFGAVLDAIASGALRTGDLVTHRHAFADALRAYESVTNDAKSLGIVLEYPDDASPAHSVSIPQTRSPAAKRAPVVGVIGSGGFARAVILPGLQKAGARIRYVAARSKGVSLVHAARKFGAEEATMDYRRILDDPEIDAVFVVTGHHQHARFVCEALDAGKHVFVEKPLAIDPQQLAEVRAAVERNPGLQLMVGFNRRFSPHARKIRELTAARSEPLCMTMTVNAGAVPPDSWIHDPARGGGRIVGEACHFIDLMVSVCGSEVASVSAVSAGDTPLVRSDRMTIALRFADGSIGSVNYFSNGSKSFPKETMEIFSDGRVLRLENFRTLRGHGFPGFKSFGTPRQDKGHAAELRLFLDRVAKGGEPLIPFSQIESVTNAAFEAAGVAAT